MRESTDARLGSFVRALYFDLQRIDGVKPLEIWNGVRESFDPFESAGLVKNLYKIVVPLVNTAFFGRPFDEHGRAGREAVESLVGWYAENPESRLFHRFPHPPVGDEGQKELYGVVRDRARQIVDGLVVRHPAKPTPQPAGQATQEGIFPDGLFDFREMRLVDNELPYIIFTDKEFRVIHGLAVTYLWLIDIDARFTGSLESLGVGGGIAEEYRKFTRRVHRENPLTIGTRKMDAEALVAHIHEKLKYEDYLDLFENVYRWLEATREKLAER
jgi:hypothetical protein